MTWTQAVLLAFIAGLALVSWRLARPRLGLLVTDRGILDRRLRLGWIHWDEIEGAYEPSARDRDSLRLRLRVSERLGRKLRRRARRVAAPGAELMDVRLDLSGSDIGPLELLQEILSRTRRRD